MAYGTVYSAPYKKTNGTERVISLKKDGFAGSPIVWKTALNPVTFDYGAGDYFFSDIIVSSQARLEFLFEAQYEMTDFIEDPDTYLVEIHEGSTLIWSGFVEPWDARHDYKQPGYFMSMTASCGLNKLSKKDFYINENNFSALTQWETVLRVLGLMGIDRGIYVSVHTAMNAYPAAPNPLTSVICDIYRYFPDSQWLGCDIILSDILNKYNAQIFQWQGKWVIRGIVDHALGVTGYIEYDSAGGIVGIGSFSSLNIPVNSDTSLTLEGSSIGLQGSIRKYVANVDLGQNRFRLENGGLQLWGPSGPTGWALVNISESSSEGYQKVNTGSETKPFALQINGIRPRPWTKKVKKKGWSFKKWYTVELEPDSYAETPQFEVKATDKEITLSFEFQTEGGNGFAYSAMIHNQNAPDGNLQEFYYYTKAVGAYDAQKSFTALFVPGHPVVNPETGVAQSKGTVEIKIRLEPQFIAWEDKYGSRFKADYIKIRFYKTHDDSKGGDSYTIFNVTSGGVDITGESLDATDADGRYKVVLQHKEIGNDESSEVNLISGDYNQDYIGATYGVEALDTGTKSWSRRGASESLSIYRAMLYDRLCMTHKSRLVIEGPVKVLNGHADLHYLNQIILTDDGDRLYKIVRFRYEEYRSIATVTAIEINFQELNIDDYTQKNFTDARGLLNDNEDGVYPVRELPTVQIADPEADLVGSEEDYYDNVRTGILFDGIEPLEYIAAEESTDTVDLNDYFSELYLDDQTQEEEDRHDTSTFEVVVTDKPSWVSKIEIEGLVVTVTAKPPFTGTFYINIDVIDNASEDGLVVRERIPILVTENEDYIEEWPPKFQDLPTLYFLVGKKDTRHILLKDYLDPEGDHDGKGLIPKLIAAPGWVSETNIVNMDLSVTGKPVEPGIGYVSYLLRDAVDRVEDYQFAVVAIAPPKVTYLLLDTSGDTPLILGELPGTYLKPDKWEVKAVVEGDHDRFYSHITGGGSTGSQVDHEYTQPVIYTDSGEYYAFENTGGVSTDTGFFEFEFALLIDEFETKRDSIKFALVDEELLAKIKIYLVSAPGGDVIGEVSIGGESVFLFPETAWDVKFVIDGINHDSAVWSLSLGGDSIRSSSNSHTAATDAEYLVYGSTQTGQLPGTYTTKLTLSLSGGVTFIVDTDFSITQEVPKPKTGGINLIEFKPNTINYEVLAEIPYQDGEYNLPDNWSLEFTGFGVPVKSVKAQLFQKKSGVFTEINAESFTGYGNIFVYSLPLSELELLIWRYKNSTDIGNIHSAPSTFRAVFTGYDESDVIVGIRQATFAFRDPPIDPEDLSNIAFLSITGSSVSVIDSNMPKSGRVYELPKFPAQWNTSVRMLPDPTGVHPDGMPFNRLEVRLLKKIGGVYVNLHNTAATYMNLVYTGGTATGFTRDGVSIIDFIEVGDLRYGKDAGNVNILIDEPGDYKVSYSFKQDVVTIGVLESEFKLVEYIEDDTETSGDCGCDCKEFFFTTPSTTWNCPHNMDKYPDITVLIGGTKVFSGVEYLDKNNVRITHKRPQVGEVILC